MEIRKAVWWLGFFLFLIAGIPHAHAGFGITPPYVRNDPLTRNSEYSQRILLTRSDPVEDLKVKITIDVPGASNWVSVDRGTEFIFQKGESVLPMNVIVKIPQDAKYGTYLGNVRVVVNPLEGPTPGTVGISLGAQIDVNLVVSDKKILDFKVRGVRITDLEEGRISWNFFFPGKIRFFMQVQNLGNVPFGPSKVVFDIYDAQHQKLLESTTNTNRLKKVQPFDVEEVAAELPTRLPPGSYRGEFKIYGEEKMFYGGEVNLSILPLGTLPDYAGYGFDGLRPQEQALILGGASFIVLLLGLATWQITTLVRKRRRYAPYRA